MDEKLEIAVAALLEIAQGSLSLDDKMAARRALDKIHMLAVLSMKPARSGTCQTLADYDLLEATR